ncbi:cytochrome P450 monooxygenase, partial [Metarhizium majus ARSEF 297]
MTDLYEQEKRLQNCRSVDGTARDGNLMTALVQASTKELQASSSTTGGLSEKEICGNMFVFNFARNDTTAHTLTFMVAFLAANPAVQDGIHDEIWQVSGERCLREAV